MELYIKELENDIEQMESKLNYLKKKVILKKTNNFKLNKSK